jgi:hypothetical protein
MDVRASQLRSATPSTSTWQHWGVSMAGQRSMGARLTAAAEVRAAKAAKARVVNCILEELVWWLWWWLVERWLEWMVLRWLLDDWN